jgi:hypothetical protein
MLLLTSMLFKIHYHTRRELGPLASSNLELTSEITNRVDSWFSSCDGERARHQISICIRQHKQRKPRTYIHNPCGIRTYDPSVRAIKGKEYPRLCGHSELAFYALILLFWFYSPLLGLGRFFSFLILYTVGRTPWMGDHPSQDRYLHTEQHKQNKRTQYRHRCLEWHSNPRSQRSNERRQFMP